MKTWHVEEATVEIMLALFLIYDLAFVDLLDDPCSPPRLRWLNSHSLRIISAT